ncbi:MAG: S-layer protein [Candidatus Methanofastidiosia archaeon]|jgi:hypothetical protein
MKNRIVVLALLVLCSAVVFGQQSLPPKDFFVKANEPQTVIVVGDTASADDVISATLLATRIAELTTPKQVEVTKTVFSENEYWVLSNNEFIHGDYHLLFDLDQDMLWMYNYQLERLKDTIPGGFIPTYGRTWASRTTNINLLSDYYSMLEIRQYKGYTWWYVFYGIPRNYEHQYFKNGETRYYGKYAVTLLEVDVDEMEAKIRIQSDTVDDIVVLPVYCKDCKHVVGELFCNATDPLPAQKAADTLQREFYPFFVDLKYFVGGPLSNQDAVDRSVYYWNATALPTPDMYIDGVFHIPHTSTDYYTDYWVAFNTAVRKKVPIRVYTTGFIRDDTGQVNVFLSSDYYFDNLVMWLVLFEKNVKESGTEYHHIVREVADPVYLSMRAQSTFEYSYTFAIPGLVTDPETNLGAVVFVQNVTTKTIYQADVLDLKEKRVVYEVDIDADFDGRAHEVEFAIECTKIPFLGVQGNFWARFNIYTLTDYGVLFPQCCDTPFFEDNINQWDLEIFKKNNLGYIMVKVCNPFDIHCLEPGDIIYGPRHLTRVKIIDVTKTHVHFYFQYMKIVKKDVEGITKIEPTSLLKLASEVTKRDLQTYHVILVGGPAVNPYTEQIVGMGLSDVEWEESSGEWELVMDPFGYGKNALIVAGKDRNTTSFAARKLYYALQMYEED